MESYLDFGITYWLFFRGSNPLSSRVLKLYSSSRLGQLFLHLSNFQFIHPPVQPSIHPSIYIPAIHLVIHQFMFKSPIFLSKYQYSKSIHTYTSCFIFFYYIFSSISLPIHLFLCTSNFIFMLKYIHITFTLISQIKSIP